MPPRTRRSPHRAREPTTTPRGRAAPPPSRATRAPDRGTARLHRSTDDRLPDEIRGSRSSLPPLLRWAGACEVTGFEDVRGTSERDSLIVARLLVWNLTCAASEKGQARAFARARGTSG